MTANKMKRNAADAFLETNLIKQAYYQNQAH